MISANRTSNEGTLIPEERYEGQNMRQEALRSKQGIVWNALERGHSLTEGELGKGGGDTGAKAARRENGPIKTTEKLTRFKCVPPFSSSELRILEEQIGAGKAVRN